MVWYFLLQPSEVDNIFVLKNKKLINLGGLRESFYAYKYYVQTFGKEPKLAGFEQYSAEQLFFISFGNLWCETMTVTALRASLEDSHCPGRIRLLGSLMNSKEFHQAFNCKKGHKMYQLEEKQCIIW